MSYQQFKIGFWHPFGPHGGETAEEIIERKKKEIAANGWTLWSFQIRQTLKAWYDEILLTAPDSVFVFCSGGKGAKEPVGRVDFCKYYRFINATAWSPIPDAIRIQHPIGTKTAASAFRVKKIIYPVENIHAPTVKWYSLNGETWRDAGIPTRGEYLIMRGGSNRMRPYRAVLVLEHPYLAVVSTRMQL